LIAQNSKETGEIIRISPRKSARGIRPLDRTAILTAGNLFPYCTLRHFAFLIMEKKYFDMIDCEKVKNFIER
jgi:hypothetical protein